MVAIGVAIFMSPVLATLLARKAGGAARNRKQGGVGAAALLIDEFVNGDAGIGAQAEGRLFVEADAKRLARPGLQYVVLEDR